MTEIRIDELDWAALDGKTVRITVKVMGDKAYVIEGAHVYVADLAKGPIAEELPFFGPRSERTGRLTDEQKRALDLLIREGYTAHRAAMLLGIHDSTVQNRKKALRTGRAVGGSAAPSNSRTAPLTDFEIGRIKHLYFEQQQNPAAIAGILGRSENSIRRYVKLLGDGEFSEVPIQRNAHGRVIDQNPVAAPALNGRAH